MKLKTIVNILLLLTFFSCKKKQEMPNYKRSFYQAFDIIKSEYIRKNEINWKSIEKSIIDSIPIFRNNDDVYTGIKYTLKQIKDKHSLFLPPDSNKNCLIKNNISIPKIDYRILENNIGYLKINGLGTNDSLSNLYSFAIRKALITIDKQKNLKGWIIDLQNNCGGKAGTFQLGLAPLYNDSIIGCSRTSKGEFIKHKLSKNTYFYGNLIAGKIDSKDILTNKNRPIAILVNGKTASMGESTALSFKFQKKSIIIGTKTNGLTTDLMVYEFVSGARMCLSTAYMCNEKNNIMPNGVIPDIICNPQESLKKAIYWINNYSEIGN